MANDETLSPRQRLRKDISTDIHERSEWREKRETLRLLRLGERKRNVIYPRAPNFTEPIIDDNVRSITSSENQIMWSGRFLANFLPLNDEASELKRHAENAFNTLLKFGLNIRAKMEAILDHKNSDGMAIAKMVPNNEDYLRLFGEDETIPDFEEIDPLDLIVPVGTRELKDAVRIVHILKLTELELRKRGERAEWKNVDEIIDFCRAISSEGHGNASGEGEDEGAPEMIGILHSNPSEDLFVIWEVYHETKEGRFREIMCPDNAELEILKVDWEWPEIIEETIVRDELTGEAVGVEEDVSLPVRRWPFFQFRFEGRTRDYYDVRGASEMLEDNQKAATQYANIRGVHFDFFGHPLLEGGSERSALANFRWRPGEKLPEGVTIAQMPQLDPSLDFSMDRERAAAARRVGGTQGALLSATQQRERKTATEVNREALVSTGLSSDAVRRVSEPFSDLYTEMWIFLKHHPIKLPMIDDQLAFRGFADMAVFKVPFIVVSSPNTRASNPDFILQQLTQLQTYFANNPFVDVAKLTQIVVDQIDPQLTDALVLDPEAEGKSGVPIVEQIEGIMGALNQMNEQLQAQQQFLTAHIQEVQIKEEAEKLAARGGNGETAQPAQLV